MQLSFKVVLLPAKGEAKAKAKATTSTNDQG
jgi:hypothetical protein